MVWRRTAAFVGILCLSALSLGGLELQSGGMKLVLHEKIGRFSLYYRSDDQQEYKTFFFDKDPRTSGLSVFRDEKSYRLGESASFQLQTEETSQGAAFVWTSSFLEVRQDFRLVPSQSEETEILEIRLKLTNTGNQENRIGVRYLLDTQLGEDSGVHFFTPQQNRISSETLLRPSAEENYLSSGNPRDPVVLQIWLHGEGVSVPEELVLANWKRLSDSPWSYRLSPNRSFHLPPYSINDSALGIYYPQEVLEPGEVREISTLMGNWNRDGLQSIPDSLPEASPPDLTESSPSLPPKGGDPVEAAVAEPKDQMGFDADRALVEVPDESPEIVLLKEPEEDPTELLKEDLSRLEEVLDRLDRQINAADDLSAEELSQLGQILKELERSKSKYE